MQEIVHNLASNIYHRKYQMKSENKLSKQLMQQYLYGKPFRKMVVVSG
jgi:hypothetical protein